MQNFHKCGYCIDMGALAGCHEQKQERVLFNTTACGEFKPTWLNLGEHVQPHAEQVEWLNKTLPLLVNLPGAVIWFGASEEPVSRLKLISRGLGIRYMATAGGMQYRLFNIDSLGRENSSSYHTDVVELIRNAVARMGNYVRPLRFQNGQRISLQSTTPLGWYLEKETVDAGKELRNEVQSRLEKDLESVFGKVETITLSL